MLARLIVVHIEEVDGCFVDWVALFSVPWVDEDKELVKACSNERPSPDEVFRSEERWMQVEFSTDPSVTFPGFRLAYTAVDQDEGKITYSSNVYDVREIG